MNHKVLKNVFRFLKFYNNVTENCPLLISHEDYFRDSQWIDPIDFFFNFDLF